VRALLQRKAGVSAVQRIILVALAVVLAVSSIASLWSLWTLRRELKKCWRQRKELEEDLDYYTGLTAHLSEKLADLVGKGKQK